MATLEELLNRDEQIVEAECDALRDLAECMRNLAVELPDGSNLARRLAVYSEHFDTVAEFRRGSVAAYATLRLQTLSAEVREDLDITPEDEADEGDH